MRRNSGDWRFDVHDGAVCIATVSNGIINRFFVRGVGIAEGTGDVLAEIDVSAEAPVSHYYVSNHRGDTVVTLTDAGTVDGYRHYEAFGAVLTNIGTFTPLYTFSTKEYLPDAKLHIYAYRVYDPIAGCWTQRDPIDYQDSVNLYQFCLNNAVNQTDPNGMNVYFCSGGVIPWHKYVIIDIRDESGGLVGRRQVHYKAAQYALLLFGQFKLAFKTPWNQGMVVTYDQSADEPLPEGAVEKQTTPEQDRATEERVRQLQNNETPAYSSDNTCVTFAQEVFDKGQDAYRRKPNSDKAK